MKRTQLTHLCGQFTDEDFKMSSLSTHNLIDAKKNRIKFSENQEVGNLLLRKSPGQLTGPHALVDFVLVPLL